MMSSSSAAARGEKVPPCAWPRQAVVEEGLQLGGNCTHRGTIPSKALRHAIQLLADYRHHPLFEHTLSAAEISWPQLLHTSDQVISQQVSMLHRYYTRNHVHVFHGRGRFTDAHTLEVVNLDGSTQTLEAAQFIIATGSRPWRPAELDFSHPCIRDSDTLLDMDHTPRQVTIFGAGVIGCEYASIFANLDVKVNLVNTRDRLLSFLDDEVTDALSYHLRDQGVLLHNEALGSVVADEQSVTLTCKSGRVIRSEILLWANGRSGNTTDMGLEALGIEINSRGQIETNDRFQSSQEHIYAVGDVAGTGLGLLRPGTLRRHLYRRRQGGLALGGRSTHRHLHQPGNQLTGAHRSRADQTECPLRGRQGGIQEPGQGADIRPYHRYAEDPVPP